MNWQFSHPAWLWALVPAVLWAYWWTRCSQTSITPVRKWIALTLRLIFLVLAVLALAGLQWRRPIEGMNVFYLLDRSESVPADDQETAREWINQTADAKESEDRAGVIVFGSSPGIEFLPSNLIDMQSFQTVVPKVGTDIESAIRLASAAFPEEGQKKIVLLTDGNENLGRAEEAIAAARTLGVTVDVVPMGTQRPNDVLVQDLRAPSNLKEGQTFDLKIFVQSEVEQSATLRLFKNDQFLGEQPVQLEAGKNLFAVPQTLDASGFYDYRVQVEAAGDVVVQNNTATGYTYVRGDPTVLLISENPQADQPLAQALRESNLRVDHRDLAGMPETLPELQLFDAIFLSNIAAGDTNRDYWGRLAAATRDFGVGLVAIGGDRAFTAGGYQDTPLEDTLPLIMEVDSKKVLPRGALVMVMHGMEFNGGDDLARQVALGALEAMSPRDELGVLVYDGGDQWLFPLQQIGGNRGQMGRMIAGINQGDMPTFGGVMRMALESLSKSNANLKHMIVFSDGDPQPPSNTVIEQIAENRITISSILIQGHGPTGTMEAMAQMGNGRFYNVTSPADLPQIFLKETAVVLKTAIIEEAFEPQLVASTELTRGLSQPPPLVGYVATKPKARASVPFLTHKGDPLLAHWQIGLGRAVAFTSDAAAKWAVEWLSWAQYRQYWGQVAQWALRKVDASDFEAEVALENGVGTLQVEALDEEGGFRNFLNLQARVADPEGNTELVPLVQVGPGRYEVEFDAPKVGAYQVFLMDMENGSIRGAQSLGANVSYSPEFKKTSPNNSQLTRLADLGGGRILDQNLSADNPFRLNRTITFQPEDLWQNLLKAALLLFLLDVAVRRLDVDREQLAAAGAAVARTFGFGAKKTSNSGSLADLRKARAQAKTESEPPKGPPVVDPSLFEPDVPVEPEAKSRTNPSPETQPKPATRPAEDDASEEALSPAERLLQAKKRAQQWKK